MVDTVLRGLVVAVGTLDTSDVAETVDVADSETGAGFADCDACVENVATPLTDWVRVWDTVRLTDADVVTEGVAVSVWIPLTLVLGVVVREMVAVAVSDATVEAEGRAVRLVEMEGVAVGLRVPVAEALTDAVDVMETTGL